MNMNRTLVIFRASGAPFVDQFIIQIQNDRIIGKTTILENGLNKLRLFQFSKKFLITGFQKSLNGECCGSPD